MKGKTEGGENLEDIEIIELFQRRDEKAISEAAKKYGGLCTTVSKNILHNSQDAEECVNEALWKAWESIPPEEPRILSAFLAKIAKNIALNRYKALHREKRGGGEPQAVLEELENIISESDSLEEKTERRELLEAINGFLEKLPAKRRIMFVRRYWYCDRIADISERLGMSENSVSAALSRTREALKKHLRKRGF